MRVLERKLSKFTLFYVGSRLDSPIFKKIYVSTQIECIVSCVQEPCCRSINYRQRLPQSHADLCEMLHDVVYNTSAELEKNRFYDYVYFNEPQKVNKITGELLQHSCSILVVNIS